MKKQSKRMLCLFFCLLTGQLVCAQSATPAENSAQPELTFSSSDLVCQLTGPELVKRLVALKKEVFAKVLELEEVESGYVFHFEDQGDFLIKLTDYILAERKCCPFFQFDLSIKPKQAGISLTVSGPPAAKEMIKMVME